MDLIVTSLAPILTAPTLVSKLLARLTEWVMETSGHKKARVFLIDRARNELYCQICNEQGPYEVRLRGGRGLHGQALSSKQIQRGRSPETGEGLAVIPVFAPMTSDATGEIIALLEVTTSNGHLSPVGESRLMAVASGVARVLKHARLDDSRQSPERITGVVGNSDAMLDLYDAIERATKDRSPILLMGACGVGKARIARAIHGLGGRGAAPFIEVQCHGEIDIVEVELFGLQERTCEQVPGAVERAAGGTILVKQINLLPPEVQEPLLEEANRFDTRILATVLQPLSANGTHPPLEDQLSAGLRVPTIVVPSIAERGPDDVAMLARHFVREWAYRVERPSLSLDSSALATLRSHSWPGNVQEIERCVQSAVLSCEGDTIEAKHLSLPGAGGAAASDSIPSGLLLADAEERYILRTLIENSQNRTRTASSLGIGRNTLVRKIKQYQNK